MGSLHLLVVVKEEAILAVAEKILAEEVVLVVALNILVEEAILVVAEEILIKEAYFVDIDSSVNIDSQSDLDILIAHCKKKEVAHYIHFITPCIMHIFLHNIVLLFPPLILILFSSFVSDAMSNPDWWASVEDEMHALEQNVT